MKKILSDLEDKIKNKLFQFDSNEDWYNVSEIICKLSESEQGILKKNICDAIFEIKRELLEGTLKINSAV